MTDALLANVGAYSLQIACIVVAGAALPLLVRTVAAVHYAWWRCLLVVALVLPWLLHGTLPAARTRITEVSTFAPLTANSGATLSNAGWTDLPATWIEALAVLLFAGMVLHLIWIAAGLLRLRQLGRAGGETDLAAEEAWLQELLRTRAAIRYVEALEQPVTFGVRKPVVLLPGSLRECAPSIRRAVLCHELVHVQRRDWMWLLAEETLRAAFWFHPVVRWLLARIQLAREEVVDEIAVAACGSDRRAYIEALMAFADDARLTPAPTFSRRRHLYHRIVRLSKEKVMSFRRVAILGSLTVALVVVASWLGASVFPTAVLSASQLAREAGPLEKASQPITAANPIPALKLSTAPANPSQARAANVEALVTLKVTVDQFGRVAEMRRADFAVRRPFTLSVAADPMISAGSALSASTFSGARMDVAAGPGLDNQAVRGVQPALEAMFEAAAEAVAHWQYEAPRNAPLSFMVRFLFRPEEPEASVVAEGRRFPAPFGMPPVAVMTVPRGSGEPPQVTYPPQAGAAAGGSQTSQMVWSSGVRVAEAGHTQVAMAAPLRVGSGIAVPVRLKHVAPVYPEEAQAARIQGVVIIEATVGADGRVADARILRSVPMLDAAALEAVRQWEYQPTLLNGVPTPVVMTTTVQFSLPQ